MFLSFTGCRGKIHTVQDLTGTPRIGERIDWRYNAQDVRLQAKYIMKELVTRWYNNTGYKAIHHVTPHIIFAEIENRSDAFISLEAFQDVLHALSIEDTRYTVEVHNVQNERELNALISKMKENPHYAPTSKVHVDQVLPPQIFAKFYLSHEVSSGNQVEYLDYRMTITFYDFETREPIDSISDTLRKKINTKR